jgi:hypothetical protein
MINFRLLYRNVSHAQFHFTHFIGKAFPKWFLIFPMLMQRRRIFTRPAMTVEVRHFMIMDTNYTKQRDNPCGRPTLAVGHHGRRSALSLPSN